MTEINYPNSPKNIDLNTTCLNAGFGDLKFEQALPHLEKMKATILEFESFDYLQVLTQQEINQIESLKTTFNNYIQQIQNFSLSQENPKQIRDNIENQIINFYNNSFAQLTRSSLNYLRQQAKLDAKTEKELQDTVINAKKLEKELNDKLASIKEAEKSVEKGSGIVASKFLSKEFEEQFQTHQNSSGGWFIATVAIYASLFIWSITGFFIYMSYIRPQSQQSLSIEWGIFNFLIIAVLFYGLRLAVRNFNIHKNLAAINRHRRNVAQTLINFLESEKANEPIKNILIKDASLALFEHKSTGYLARDQMQINTPIQEMVTKIITDKT